MRRSRRAVAGALDASSVATALVSSEAAERTKAFAGGCELSAQTGAGDSDSEMHAVRPKQGRVAAVPGARYAKTGSLAEDENCGRIPSRRLRCASRGSSHPAISSLNAGSWRSGSRSESPSRKERVRSESSIARRRCAMAWSFWPARLSQQATL
jgi:hypothetical protein